MTSPMTASAPATCANLGPAFDSMAIAIEIRCSVRAESSDEWSVDHLNGFRPGPNTPDAVLIAAMKAVGHDNPLNLVVDTAVPIGKGLGSSSAALVSGAAAALGAVYGDVSHDHVYRIATELEGHADNVAGAVYGGLVLVPAEGLPMRLPMHPSLQLVVAVPDRGQPTSEARAVLAPSHPHDLTVRTIARVAALTAGLLTADPSFLSAAHGDEIHEQPRAALSPEVEDLIRIARTAGALHAARAGAGSSVVAIVTKDRMGPVAKAFEDFGARALTNPVATTGLEITQ